VGATPVPCEEAGSADPGQCCGGGWLPAAVEWWWLAVGFCEGGSHPLRGRLGGLRSRCVHGGQCGSVRLAMAGARGGGRQRAEAGAAAPGIGGPPRLCFRRLQVGGGGGSSASRPDCWSCCFSGGGPIAREDDVGVLCGSGLCSVRCCFGCVLRGLVVNIGDVRHAACEPSLGVEFIRAKALPDTRVGADDGGVYGRRFPS
jgi:hypothetical protein